MLREKPMIQCPFSSLIMSPAPTGPRLPLEHSSVLNLSVRVGGQLQTTDAVRLSFDFKIVLIRRIKNSVECGQD
jgi:hypothetical protein